MTTENEMVLRRELDAQLEENLMLVEMSQLMMDSLARIALNHSKDPMLDAMNTIRGLKMIVPDGVLKCPS